jgi:hypothetical protein
MQEDCGAEALLELRSPNRNLLSLPSIVYTIFSSVPSGLVVDSHYVYGTWATEPLIKVPWNKRNTSGAYVLLALVSQTPTPFLSDKKHYAPRQGETGE